MVTAKRTTEAISNIRSTDVIPCGLSSITVIWRAVGDPHWDLLAIWRKLHSTMTSSLLDRSQYPCLRDSVYLNQASLGLIGQPAVAAMHSFLENVARHGNLYKDRKSTRLNSSHGYISYAVFCLKKKKNTRLT